MRVFTGEKPAGRRVLRGGVFFLSLLPLLLAGCISTKQTVRLNPDGSGKVEIDAVVPMLAGMFSRDNAAAADPEKQARDQVASILQQAQGIDAWSGVSWELTDELKLRFRATAYFPDIAAVEMSNLNTLLAVSFLPDESGNRVLLVNEKKKEAVAAEPAETLSEEEIARRIRYERAQFNQLWAGMSGFIAEFRQEAVFYLPGRVVSSTNLENLGDGQYRFLLEGRRLVEVMTALAADDAWWREQVIARRDIVEDGAFGDEWLQEKLFGEKGRVRAVVAPPLEPLFNYSAEVAAARRETEALLKSLGAETPGSAAIRLAPAPAPEARAPARGPFRPEPVEGAWSIDQPFDEIPNVPLTGEIFGRGFELGSAVFSPVALTIESRERIGALPAARLVIFTMGEEGGPAAGKTWLVTPDAEGPAPHVHMNFAREGGRFPATLVYTGQYSMRLEIVEAAGITARVKLHLSLPDYKKSHLIGVFSARLE